MKGTDFFDLIAPRWDSMEILSTPEKVRHILGRLDIGSDMEILDLGTGTGVLVPYLHEMVGAGGRIVGVDSSSGMLEVAHRKFPHLSDTVEFIQADFEKDTIAGRFDRILLYSVYPHLHQPAATLRRLIRDNLKEGGTVTIAFPTDERFINNVHGERDVDSERLLSAPRLCSVLRDKGFDARVVESTPEAYIISINGTMI